MAHTLGSNESYRRETEQRFVHSKPVDGRLCFPSLQLLSVTVRAVIARLGVAVVIAGRRSAFAGLQVCKATRTAQGVMPHRHRAISTVQSRAQVPQAICVASGRFGWVVSWVMLLGKRRQAGGDDTGWAAQTGGRWVVLGMGRALC